MEMIAAKSPEAPKVTPAKTRAAIWCGGMVVWIAVSVALAGGHPRTNWFYAFALAIGAVGAFSIVRRGERPIAAGDQVPKSVARALAAGALGFVFTTAFMYVYCNLLWTDTFFWGADVVVSGMVATNYYRQKRGYAYSAWPSFVVLVVVLAAALVLKWAGLLPRGV